MALPSFFRCFLEHLGTLVSLPGHVQSILGHCHCNYQLVLHRTDRLQRLQGALLDADSDHTSRIAALATGAVSGPAF